MAELYSTTTNTGNGKLIYGGYAYSVNKTIGSTKTKYWRCCRYNELRCRGRLKSIDGERLSDPMLLKFAGEHNHEPDPTLLTSARAKDQLKEKATTTKETTQDIIVSVTTSLTQGEASALPKVGALRRAVQRARSAAIAAPANPACLEDLKVPEDYSKTLDGRPFLLHDSGAGDGERRMLVFATSSALDALEKSRHWFCDGTFRHVPYLFSQLYTIHVSCDGAVLPAVFGLLPDKQRLTFSRFLTALTNARPKLAPETITVDFQAEEIHAFQERFPHAHIHGRFCQLVRNLYMHAQSNDLQGQYEDRPGFATEIRKLAALAFVPVSYVIACFEALEQSDSFPEDAEPVMDYFEQYYIGRRWRRKVGRRPPVFPIPLWNVYDRTLEGFSSTTDPLEEWHICFGGNLQSSRPTIWEMVTALKHEEREAEHGLERLRSGEESGAPQRKRKCVTPGVDERLRRLCEKFATRTSQDFLLGIAHYLK